MPRPWDGRLRAARSTVYSRCNQSCRHPGHHPPNHLRERLDDQGAAVEQYTTRLKIQQMYLYGDRGSTSLYEEDHFIPLELGGSPTSAKNLWPEYGHIPNPKDAVENAAKQGRMRWSHEPGSRPAGHGGELDHLWPSTARNPLTALRPVITTKAKRGA